MATGAGAASLGSWEAAAAGVAAGAAGAAVGAVRVPSAPSASQEFTRISALRLDTHALAGPARKRRRRDSAGAKRHGWPVCGIANIILSMRNEPV